MYREKKKETCLSKHINKNNANNNDNDNIKYNEKKKK